MRRNGASVCGSFFQQFSFATHALTPARNAIRVQRDAPLEFLGLLGCGVQTGAGAVLNVMKPEAGKSFAVFGAGAVGLAGLMAAKLIPHLIDLFVAGRFPIHRLVAFYDFAAINQAAMEAVNGSTVKPVLRMPQ